MATDLARVSYDDGRHYTGVVAQQGRVTLEAEQNEQRTIDAVERRRELIEIVGPAGTPDDGYAITSSAGPDLSIGGGTMYVGGVRVSLGGGIAYSQQPDWLDHAEDPDWIPLRRITYGNEQVVLVVREHEITAVEDPALYEVALGGPDGAARTRMVQHIQRMPTGGRDCAEAVTSDVKHWSAQGLSFDPETMRLSSDSRLLVTWSGPPAAPKPCEPSSIGGYLGAENQLIRVRLTGVRRDGTFDLVWGYDDASFLYRVTTAGGSAPLLTLHRSPVDDYHWPRSGQAVEVLRSAAQLRSSDGAQEGYAASLAGEVVVLASPYDPDTKTVQLPSALPGHYLDQTATPQLYLRIWEEVLTGTTGTPIELTGTGLQVTITADGGGRLHTGDYWCIGVRPSTSVDVYPARYLREGQPPDGPQSWACPLAVIGWNDDQELILLDDCRHHFDPLVDVDNDGCCTLELRPSDAHEGRLQQLIDAAVAHRDVRERGDRVTVCLEPGRYELDRPIRLGARHSNLILRGCSGAVVITAAPGSVKEFAQGLILLVEANNVTITGLEFELPQVPAALGRFRQSKVAGRSFANAVTALVANRYVSVGIRPVHCAVLAITDCLFRFSVGEHESSPETEQIMPRTVFGVGVLGGSECWGLRLTGNRFLYEPGVGTAGPEAPVHALAGYVLTPTLVSESTSVTHRAFTGTALRAVLDDAVIQDNTFDGLGMAALIAAELGTVRLDENVARDCYGGIFLLDQPAAAYWALLETNGQGADPVLLLLLILALIYPLPRGAERRAAPPPVSVPGDFDQARDRWAARHPDLPAAADRRRTSKRAGAGSAEEPAIARAAGPIAAELHAQLTTDAPSRLRLHAYHNDIDVTPEQSAVGALGVLVSAPLSNENDRPTGTSAVITANRLSAHSALSAFVFGIATVTFTGNQAGVLGSSGSLLLGGTTSVAVTGNVFFGEPTLPAGRPFPPPLDTWLPLNTAVT
jgi:hypothetical protein